MLLPTTHMYILYTITTFTTFLRSCSDDHSEACILIFYKLCNIYINFRFRSQQGIPPTHIHQLLNGNIVLRSREELVYSSQVNTTTPYTTTLQVKLSLYIHMLPLLHKYDFFKKYPDVKPFIHSSNIE